MRTRLSHNGVLGSDEKSIDCTSEDSARAQCGEKVGSFVICVASDATVVVFGWCGWKDSIVSGYLSLRDGLEFSYNFVNGWWCYCLAILMDLISCEFPYAVSLRVYLVLDYQVVITH